MTRDIHYVYAIVLALAILGLSYLCHAAQGGRGKYNSIDMVTVTCHCGQHYHLKNIANVHES